LVQMHKKKKLHKKIQGIFSEAYSKPALEHGNALSTFLNSP
jgi:hypothetical protein